MNVFGCVVQALRRTRNRKTTDAATAAVAALGAGTLTSTLYTFMHTHLFENSSSAPIFGVNLIHEDFLLS